MTNQTEEYITLKKKGFRYLRRGVIFLAVCLILSEIMLYFDILFGNLISESLIIAGWVGLWRPMEIFLYDLPDMRRENKKLSAS